MSHVPQMHIILYSMMAGRTPKLTMSARESNSLPMLEYAFNNLAANPSQKSNHAEASINGKAMSIRPSKVKITPRVPASRFIEVIVLGICLIICII